MWEDGWVCRGELVNPRKPTPAYHLIIEHATNTPLLEAHLTRRLVAVRPLLKCDDNWRLNCDHQPTSLPSVYLYISCTNYHLPFQSFLSIMNTKCAKKNYFFSHLEVCTSSYVVGQFVVSKMTHSLQTPFCNPSTEFLHLAAPQAIWSFCSGVF